MSGHLKEVASLSSSPSLQSLLQEKENKIKELQELIRTISRGKYMWESTFDAITNPVMIVSETYHIRRANRAAAKAAQLDVREMIGTTCHESFAGQAEPCRGCPMRETVKSSASHFFCLDPFKKSARQYAVNAYPLEPDEDGAQVVLYYRDVTEEKALQRQLVHSEKIAAIGTLAGGVAHEINNPLGGILAFVQLAQRDVAPEHAVQTDLKEIEDAALRCKRIVQDLLDFSRQSRDEVMSPVNLNDVLQKIMPLISVQLKTQKTELITDFNPGLPKVLGDFHKLQQVFLNLVTNAYQAMGNKGNLKIRSFENRDEGTVIVEVEDSGPGIAPENISRIFDPYFTTKAQGQGTGLGLSITYGIVKEHSGDITVRNGNGGSGAIFSVSLPAAGKK